MKKRDYRYEVITRHELHELVEDVNLFLSRNPSFRPVGPVEGPIHESEISEHYRQTLFAEPMIELDHVVIESEQEPTDFAHLIAESRES